MASSLAKMLECPVCFEKMCLPKQLPCGHTFCIVCLNKIAEEKQRNQINCPNCRKTHNLPKNGVNGFNNNYTLLELISLNVDSKPPSPPPAPLTLTQDNLNVQNFIQYHARWYHETTKTENISLWKADGGLRKFERDVLVGSSLGMLGFGIYLNSEQPKV